MRNELRVLQTLDAVGGVWRYALDLARALHPLGVGTVFLGFGPRPSDAQAREAQALGSLDWADAPLDWLAGGPEELASIPALVAKAARRHVVDLLHLNLPTQAAGLQADRPVVVVSHSCVPTWFRSVRDSPPAPGWEWQGDLNARGLASASIVVAPSQSHADALTASYGPIRGLRVVPNATQASEERRPEQPFVLASGRWWDEGKGAATLDAAAKLTAWPVRLLGPTEGPNGATFEPRHVKPLGELPHPRAVSVMQEAGIFVSPSVYEPFGLAVAEAARAGLPLVLSDIPTFRELWDDAALFVPPRDPGAVADALNRLAADPAERRRMGEAARRRARRFTPAAQARSMLSLYKELAGSERPLAAAR
jgi:glycosyltransferase involved in cell wall biosynthesis